MRILYISKNMQEYKSAMYQHDIMKELNRQADVRFYGPGFLGYNVSDSIHDVIANIDGKPDWIVVGHAWLRDAPCADIDPHPSLILESCKLPKAVILNKEYTNLSEKLAWIKRNKFSIAFTHHHNVDYFSEQTDVKFIFWPFGFDDKLFDAKEIKKDIDFSFSGILQNQNKHANQTDTRIQVMNRMFFCLGDIPLRLRENYARYNVFWNTVCRNKWEHRFAMMLGKYRFLSDAEYSAMQRRTKVYLNTLSPFGLVSPRLAENMASRTLAFCEESSLYKHIYPDDCFVTFKSDLSDFDEKLTWYIENEKERNKIAERAFQVVMENHTWRDRVNQFIDALLMGNL